MGFQINYGGYAFAVPGDVVDHYLRLAGEKELKTLLFLLRHAGSGADAAHAAAFLKIPEEQAAEAMQFWEQAGILHAGGAAPSAFPFDAQVQTENAPVKAAPEKKEPVSRIGSQRSSKEIKLDPSEIAAVVEKSQSLSGLFALAEKTLGRPLNHMEQRSLVWMHQYLNIPCEILHMLLQYCISIDKFSISYAESIAIRWESEGILTLEDADAELQRMTKDHSFVSALRKMFEMKRSPTSSQKAFIDLWQQKGYSLELIHYAYEISVEHIDGNLSFEYINKILTKWEEEGITDPEEAKKLRETQKWSPPAKTRKATKKKSAEVQMSQQELDELNDYMSLSNHFKEDETA